MDIFISSVITNYTAYRNAAYRAIQDLGHNPSRFEDLPSLPSTAATPRTACLEFVGDCDAMVLLLGARYGSMQEGSSKSATYEEWEEACRTRKPVLVFVEAVEAREDLQREFVREVSSWDSGSVWTPYKSPEELYRQVVRALARFARPVEGVRTIADWWAGWLASTTVPLDGDIVLAGRGQQVEDFRRACQNQHIVTVGGDVRRDEILAFVAAALSNKSGSESAGLGEVFYIDDPATAGRLLGSAGGVTVVLASDDLFPQPSSGSSDRLIVPVPVSQQVDIELPAVDAKAVAERLEALGERHNLVWDLGALARRSLLALRRHYATQPGLFRPGWAREAAPMTLRRGLLLNRWNQTRTGDRHIVERFFGRPYATVEEDLKQFTDGVDDPPFALVADQWHVVSAADMWDMIGRQLTTDEVNAFAEAAVDVLVDPDPLASMSPAARLLAMMEGIGPKYSLDLKRGITTTLAIAGSSDTQMDGASTSTSEVAETIVWRLVETANADTGFETWTTLAPSLPLLAEAAPDSVMEGFRRGLSGEDPLLAAMFWSESPDPVSFRGPEPCVYFLAALKILAWSPRHIGAVVGILGTLAELDPQATPSRAGRSLTEIMFPPRPNTSASAESRLEAIHRLRRIAGTAAWNLMVSMLPTSHMSAQRHPGPRYRNWKYRPAVIAQDEFASVTRSIVPMLIEDAGQDPARWASLVKSIDYLAIGAGLELIQETVEVVVDGLNRFLDTVTDEAVCSELWSALRDMVARHREFSHTPWALPESMIGLFDPPIKRLTPQDFNVRYRWLFTAEPVNLGDRFLHDDHDVYDRELLARRVEAVEIILEHEGWDALVDFTNSVDAPEFVGSALAQSGDDRTDRHVLQGLTEERAPMAYMALEYFRHRFGERGWGWVDQLINTNDLPPHVTADLLCATRDPTHAWPRVDQLGDEVAHQYWTRFRTLGHGLSYQQVEEAVHRYQAAGQHDSALAMLAPSSRRYRDTQGIAELVADSLEAAMGHDFGEGSEIRQYDFERLLQVLSNHADDLGSRRVALIEWYYMPTLGHGPDPTTLHKLLSGDPDSFVQVIKLIYRPATPPSEELPEPTKQDRALANSAEILLESWRGGPGLDAEGQVDERLLQAWVHEARNGLAKADRVDVGDDAIGESLAFSPAEPDGTWPSRPVRDLFEDLENDTLEEGFERGIYNSRGVVTRSVDAGGTPERQLAEHYRTLSKRYSAGWPRTAAIFSRLSRALRAESTGEDQTTERRQRGLDH